MAHEGDEVRNYVILADMYIYIYIKIYIYIHIHIHIYIYMLIHGNTFILI